MNHPLNIPTFPRNSIQTNTLKDICLRGNLKEAFQSLTVSFNDHPDETYGAVLDLCAHRKALPQGLQIHAHMIKSCSVPESVFLGTKLVLMYGKCGSVENAEKVFDKMGQRSSFTWNAMIGAYVSNGKPFEVLETYKEMRVLGVSFDAYSFPFLLKASGWLKNLYLGAEIHGLAVKFGYESVVCVVNSLFAMYSKCNDICGARRLFGRMVQKDDVVVSWNSIISAYSSSGKSREALELFREMQKAGLDSNTYTVVASLQACEDYSFRKLGKEIHAAVLKSSQLLDVHVAGALIAMYVRCCNMSEAVRTFNELVEKDKVAWNSLLTGFIHNGMYSEALHFFHDFRNAVEKPDQVTVISILLACGRLRFLLNGMELHAYAMKKGFDLDLQAFELFQEVQLVGIDVDPMMIGSALLACSELACVSQVKEIHGCMIRRAFKSALSAVSSLSALKYGKEIHGFIIRQYVILEGSIASSLVDMYSRCGMVESAYKIFKSLQSKDLVLWTSMINAYGTHGYGKVAINLFNKMKENLTPDHIAFLSVLYACSHSGLIDEGRQFFQIMKYEYQLEPRPEHYACLVDLLGRANCLEEAYEFVKRMQMAPTAEIWCALLRACQVHSNQELREIASRKLLALNPENPGHYVLIYNVFAEEGRCKDAEKIRTRMKERGLKKSPGCSWIEVENRIHTFLARDKAHPESQQITKKLDQIKQKLEKEGGYVPQTKFVLHNVEEKES
ncbi:Beige/BEACH domain,WD domain, G-beta repeat protein [Hibiscus syriacus]|uniref:Beige/BEACH domain,WD domain, G-beta repeat protein n=1 Tax=Hibiscus syriacus TaxID=106335 RepID=A0A6A2Y9P1_HIBSY|nr:Beige/BEACH domain,WD domain, G-beta repeat protein [Hibiscus syriacus]